MLKYTEASAKYVFRRVHPRQNRLVKQKSQRAEKYAQRQEVDQCRGDRRLHIPQLLRAQELGHYHGASNASADGDGNKDIGNGIGSADRCQRLLTYEPAYDDRVHNIIKLLK